MVDIDTSNILPTLYEYYTEGGIHTGLNDTQEYFTLNGKKIKIFSGALHYFRVHPNYWRDRLRKYRAAGLICVETYIPWNVHEPENGHFDFGINEQQNDFSFFLNLVEFIKLAQQEDLFVILRPGPYICAEWEFGGLPSWLLRTKDIKLRTSDSKFMFYVERYFKQLFALIEPLQFTKGGPVIALQIENEYGNVKEEKEDIDRVYLEALKNLYISNGIVELLFTSDTPSAGFYGTLPDILATANFQDNCTIELSLLKARQPNKPLMVTEYWTGWFDHYTENHHIRSKKDFQTILDEILSWNSSFNLYMMHGGTNWGFFNGANIWGTGNMNAGFQPDTTSYDYDAPLSENGDYTDKYVSLQKLINKYNDIYIRQPPPPEAKFRIAYSEIPIQKQITVTDLISLSPYQHIESENVLPMEMLDINNNSGQSYGYIVYRKRNITIKSGMKLKIEGHICDTVMVVINGKLISKVFENENDLNGFGYWRQNDSTLTINKDYNNAVLDLIVENFGRVNYGKLYQFNQYKGLWQGNVLLDNEVIKNWQIYPLEFKKKWTRSLNLWTEPTFETGPKLYKANFNIDTEVKDTYIDFTGWCKGFIIVNGFVLSRYFKIGPQQTAYLPAPFLKVGVNEILIFEHFTPGKSIKFCTDPYFETIGDGKVLRKAVED